jgi:predicted RNA-binding Zn ribbon-like protein
MEVAAMEVAATAIMAAMEVAAMEVAATAAAIMAAMEVAATAAAIMDLISLTLINLLEQKVGKTEVMEMLLTTLNMKMVGAEEKGECPMRAILQTRQISNPFLQELSLI